MKSYLLRAGLLIVIVLAALFIVLQVLAIRGDLSSAPRVDRPWLLALGVLVFCGAPLTYAFLWRSIAGRLDNMRPPLVDTLSVFYVTWLGRYVPSSIPYVAGKFVLGLRLGHSKHALAASVVYENVLVIGIGIIGSSIIIPVALSGESSSWLLYAGALAGGVAALALVSPAVVYRLATVVAAFTRQRTLGRGEVLSYRGLAVASGLTACALALNGLGFALVLDSFTGLSGREMIASGAIFNLAGVLGMLAIFVPSGIGVREAALIGLLQVFVPVPIAAAAAVLARLIGLMIDVVFGTLGAGTLAIRQRRQLVVLQVPIDQQTLDAA